MRWATHGGEEAVKTSFSLFELTPQLWISKTNKTTVVLFAARKCTHLISSVISSFDPVLPNWIFSSDPTDDDIFVTTSKHHCDRYSTLEMKNITLSPLSFDFIVNPEWEWEWSHFMLDAFQDWTMVLAWRPRWAGSHGSASAATQTVTQTRSSASERICSNRSAGFYQICNPMHHRSYSVFLKMADMLVTGGYRDVGYDTVIIDDCWLDHKRYD